MYFPYIIIIHYLVTLKMRFKALTTMKVIIMLQTSYIRPSKYEPILKNIFFSTIKNMQSTNTYCVKRVKILFR